MRFSMDVGTKCRSACWIAAASVALLACEHEPDAIAPDRSFVSAVEWALQLGGSGDERIADLTEDAQGNLFAIGTFSGATNLDGSDLSSAGADDAFLLALAQDSTLLWAKVFGSTGADTGFSVASDAQGNVIAVGEFSGAVDFGGGELTAAGSDGFVVKLDASGNHLWSRQIGGAGSDAARAVVATSTGDVAVVGSFSGTITVGTETLVSAGETDVFAVLFDPDGNVTWAIRFGGAGQDAPRCLTRTAVDQLLVTGDFEGSLDVDGSTLESNGGRDAFVLRLTSVAALEWSRAIGGPADDDVGLCAAIQTGGAIELSGTFTDTVDLGGGVRTSAGQEDIFVAKWDAAGAYAWDVTFGDVNSQRATDISVDEELHCYVSGLFDGSVMFENVARQAAGGGDALVFRLGIAGVPLRSNVYGDAAAQSATAVQATRDGFVALGGEFRSTIDFGQGPVVSKGARDAFIVKLTR